jgi:drug/metabolite transporter (DMT)-like permease
MDPFGGLLLVLAPMFWAIGSLYARRAPAPKRALVAVGMQMLAGSVVLALAGIVTGELGDVRLSAISLESMLGLGWLVVFGSIVGYSAYVWLLRVTRTSLVGTYAYVNPVVAVGLGWLILDERITARTLIAGGIIVVAVALIVTARGARADHAEPEATEDGAEPARDDRIPAERS